MCLLFLLFASVVWGNMSVHAQIISSLSAVPNMRGADRKIVAGDFFQALANKDRVTVENLLAAGVDATITNAEGKTPFDVASATATDTGDGKYAALAAMLLRAVAGLDGQDEKGWTPLNWAVVSDDQELIRQYIKDGANPFRDRQPSNLHHSALEVAKMMGNEAMLIMILYEELGCLKRSGFASMIRKFKNSCRRFFNKIEKY